MVRKRAWVWRSCCVRVVHQLFGLVVESPFRIPALLYGGGECQGHDRIHGKKGLPEQERLIFGLAGEWARPLMVPNVAHPAKRTVSVAVSRGPKWNAAQIMMGTSRNCSGYLCPVFIRGPKIPAQVMKSTRSRKPSSSRCRLFHSMRGCRAHKRMAGVTIRIPVASPIHQVSQMTTNCSGDAYCPSRRLVTPIVALTVGLRNPARRADFKTAGGDSNA